MTAIKLPLAVRKNARDDFEAKKPDLEKALSELLKETWTLDFDIPKIWSDSSPDSYGHDRPGRMLFDYAESINWQLKQAFIPKAGDAGIKALNAVASKHSVIMEKAEPDQKISYCGVDIKDGCMRILYAEGKLGVNSGDSLLKLNEAIDKAEVAEGGESALAFKSRQSISKGWDLKEKKLQEEFAETVAIPDLKLDPNFEGVAAAMKAAGSKVQRDDWEDNIGTVVHDYFRYTNSNMSKFKGDDMMQEAFQEAITTKEVGFRVTDKLKKTYAECVIEDGKLWIQILPNTYWVNVGDVGSDVIDLL